MFSKKRKNKQKKKTVKTHSNKKRTIGLIIVTVIIIIIMGLISYNLVNKQELVKKKLHKPTSNKSISSCRRSPAFPMKYGLKAPYAIDLRQGIENMGLKIMEAKIDGKVLKLPEWDDFGYLGLYTIDNKGNIYTSPLPYVSIDINPPKEQNKILIVDSKTGEMTIFMNLPSKNSPNSKNPFGVIGFTYDCNTKSLYATSVAGSTFEDESGKIFQIDPETKEIKSSCNNKDVMGITIFQGKSGKRMYLGMARKPEIYSVSLNDNGGFNNDLRFEFSLVDAPGGGYHKAHRIQIKNNVMTLKAREFSYTLIAASNSLRSIYTYKYNSNFDKWEFIEVHNE